MAISRGFILKGLLGATAVGSAGGVGVHFYNSSQKEKKEKELQNSVEIDSGGISTDDRDSGDVQVEDNSVGDVATGGVTVDSTVDNRVSGASSGVGTLQDGKALNEGVQVTTGSQGTVQDTGVKGQGAAGGGSKGTEQATGDQVVSTGQGASTGSTTQGTGGSATTTGGTPDAVDTKGAGGGSGQGTGTQQAASTGSDVQTTTGGQGKGTGGSADTQDTGGQASTTGSTTDTTGAQNKGQGASTGSTAQGTGGGSSASSTTPTTPKEPAPTTPKEPEPTEDNLGFPVSCGFKDATDKKECSLDADQFKKLKFEVKTGSTSVEITGLKGNNKIKVTIENESNKTDYPKGKKYTFKSETDKVTIKNLKDDNKDIVLEKGKTAVFKENDSGKLEYVSDVDKLGIPKRCSSDSKGCELSTEEIKEIKFKGFSDGKTVVSGVSGSNKVTLKIEDVSNDTTNYPTSKKYTFSVGSSKVTISNPKEGENTIVIDKDNDVVFAEKSNVLELSDGIKRDSLGIPEKCKLESGSSKECDLTRSDIRGLKFKGFKEGQTIVEGLGSNENIKLKTERSSDTTNYPSGKKYTLSNSNGKDVKIKIGNQDNKTITLAKSTGSKGFREEGGKLEEFREIDEQGIPKDCKEGQECKLDGDDIKKIKFKDISDSAKKITGLSTKTNNSFKLKIDPKTSYGDQKTWTITGVSAKITISSTDSTGGSGKTVTLEANKENIFVENGGRLDKTELWDGIGLPKKCNADQVNATNTSQECEITEREIKKTPFNPIHNMNTNPNITVNGLDGSGGKIKLRIEYTTDTQNYKNNKKYTFDNTSNSKDVVVQRGNKTTKLEKNKFTHFKLQNGKYLTEHATETKLENEKQKIADKVNEMFKKAGVEGITVSKSNTYFETNKSQLKKKTEQFDSNKLKKIKFKELGGSNATGISGLSGNNQITFEFIYDGDKNKYPENVKFSFINNTGSEVKLTRGNLTLTFSVGSNKTTNFKFSNGQFEKVT